MFNAALLKDGMQILSMRGNGSSHVQVIAHQPHHNADIALLYIPGYRASHLTDPKAEVVRQAAERLGADAFFFDYHGHAPDEPQTNLCLETYMGNAAHAFEHVLDAFKHQRVVIVAHSMAAVFAMKLAARHHRNVAGMVLVAPVIGLMDRPVIRKRQVIIEAGLGYTRILQVPEIAARYMDGEQVSPKRIASLVYHPKFLRDYKTWGARKRIRKGIRSPVAIIAAERDPFVHPTHIEDIRSKFSKYKSNVLFVPGASHEMKEDPAIAALTETLMTFVPKIRARGLHL